MIRSEATQGGPGETAPGAPLGGCHEVTGGLNINRILVSVERTAGGHIVDLVPYGLKNLGVLLGAFL